MMSVANIPMVPAHVTQGTGLLKISTSKSILVNSSPLVSPICISELGQHWIKYWLVTCSAPSHYLNQWTPAIKFDWNLNLNSIIFIQENVFGNVCQNGGHFVHGDELANKDFLTYLLIASHKAASQSRARLWTGTLLLKFFFEVFLWPIKISKSISQVRCYFVRYLKQSSATAGGTVRTLVHVIAA